MTSTDTPLPSPERRDLMNGPIVMDTIADVVTLDVIPGASITRTVEVVPSLLANYDARDWLVSVEVLSLAALRRQEVVDQLEELLPSVLFYQLDHALDSNGWRSS
jgi:hypothetical protein